MAESGAKRVLVVGASGQLGRVIAHRLTAAGTTVRVLSRSQAKLDALFPTGAEIAAVDLLDQRATTEACRGVTDIVATANNFLGKGETSPLKVDLTAYQNLSAAARNTGVRRIIYVSFRGVSAVDAVDFFRLKWHIADVVKRSQVPYVIMQPSAFTDTWVDQVLADGIRRNGTTMIFGDGNRSANYMSVKDVAEFAARIVDRPDVVNESIELGGPSNLSLNDLATLVERRMGATGRRKHMPVVALKLLPHVVKLFNETLARQMSLGWYAATSATPFPKWKVAADRFGVAPETVEAYLARWSP